MLNPPETTSCSSDAVGIRVNQLAKICVASNPENVCGFAVAVPLPGFHPQLHHS
jgi:hypothetical protein